MKTFTEKHDVLIKHMAALSEDTIQITSVSPFPVPDVCGLSGSKESKIQKIKKIIYVPNPTRPAVTAT